MLFPNWVTLQEGMSTPERVSKLRSSQFRCPSSYVWDKKFGKSYRVSYGIVLACFTIGIILNFVFRQILIGLNKKLEAGEQAWAENNERIDATAEAEGITREEVMDMRRGFRYLY